jgi:cobaltochelatase CobN
VASAAPRTKALYHSTKTPLNHFYMAAYLWARQDRDALVHYGTHGTQEWTPGKERALAVTDALPRARRCAGHLSLHRR